MKIYSDPTCLNESTKLELGIVQAGESKIFEYFVKNDSQAYLEDLKFICEHAEVKVTFAPTQMNPQEVSKLILEWKAATTVKKGINTTISVSGDELWRG